MDIGILTVFNFVDKHLHVPPQPLLDTINATIKTDVEAFRSNTKDQTGYDLACKILNIISDLSRQHLKIPEHDKLVFIDHHSSVLEHHPDTETKGKPDIGAILQSHIDLIPTDHLGPIAKPRKRNRKQKQTPRQYYRLPWHLFDSVVEVELPRDAPGPAQVAAYAGLLNQARPDKPGVYCMHVSPKHYSIVWSDPSGLSSEHFGWENIAPLAAYVFSLYEPPKDHIKVDASITLDKLSDVMSSPRWTVQFQGETHPGCRVLFVGSPWTRQSWIAISADSATGGRKVIKDQYRARGRRFDEGGIFDVLHGGNVGAPAAGCVHVQCHGDVDGVYTADLQSQRQKTRMVMTTVGKPLYDCPSVFEFLKVMYDALEVHRWIFETKSILHRDISINNILLPTAPATIPVVKERPKFIDEILHSDNVGAASHALLCDFDDACICTPVQSVEDKNDYEIKQVAGELRNRTGTPAFIARSVASGEVINLPIQPPSMPTLDGDAKTVYESAHRHDTLRKYEDSEDQSHSGQLMRRPPAESSTPRHRTTPSSRISEDKWLACWCPHHPA